jgi:DNA polymerase IV
MSEQLFSIHSWPQAIVHIDGDAFFTPCEEAIHPELRGKPLITGGERGIVACASYAAKRIGVARGIPLHEARKICPCLIILPSDYETYSLFFNIKDLPLQRQWLTTCPFPAFLNFPMNYAAKLSTAHR